VTGKCGARKVGLVQKLTGKWQQKRGKNTGTCQPGGGCADGDPACQADGPCRYKGAGVALAVLLGAGLMLVTSGCATQPSRSQNMVVRDNTINVFVSPRLPAPVDVTNAVPAGVAGGDVLAQNMMIENSGTETQSPAASADSALNLPVGDTAVSALGELIGASITGALKSTTPKDAGAAAPTAGGE
jgi:hypothetical protein